MDFLEVATLYKRVYDSQKTPARLKFVCTGPTVHVPATPHHRRVEIVHLSPTKRRPLNAAFTLGQNGEASGHQVLPETLDLGGCSATPTSVGDILVTTVPTEEGSGDTAGTTDEAEEPRPPVRAALTERAGHTALDTDTQMAAGDTHEELHLEQVRATGNVQESHEPVRATDVAEESRERMRAMDAVEESREPVRTTDAAEESRELVRTTDSAEGSRGPVRAAGGVEISRATAGAPHAVGEVEQQSLAPERFALADGADHPEQGPGTPAPVIEADEAARDRPTARERQTFHAQHRPRATDSCCGACT